MPGETANAQKVDRSRDSTERRLEQGQGRHDIRKTNATANIALVQFRIVNDLEPRLVVNSLRKRGWQVVVAFLDTSGSVAC